MNLKSRYTHEESYSCYGETKQRTVINMFRVIADMLIMLITLALLIVYWPITSVPTGYRGVITQFGAIKSVEQEGIVVIWPWERLHVFNVRAETVDVNKAEGSTSDTQPVHVSLTVRYSIDSGRVSEVFEQYSRDGNLSSYVDTATQEVFKAVTAEYSATDLISKRQKVSDDIAVSLNKKLKTYGARVINIDMRSFTFSGDYMKAINDKVTQEQLKLAAENKLKTIEVEQRQKVAVAEAEAIAQKTRADAQAYQQLKLAQAQADALKIQNAALAQSRDVLELRRIEVELARANKWDGKLPEAIYAGAPIPFMNIK